MVRGTAGVPTSRRSNGLDAANSHTKHARCQGQRRNKPATPVQGDPYMSRGFLSLTLVVIGGLGWRLASATEATERPSIERGREAVATWQLNPGIWSVNAYDNIWKVWGLKEKPANLTQLFRER